MKRIRWLVVTLITTLLAQPLCAQSKIKEFFSKQKEGGYVSLGVRNTISAFSHGSLKEFSTGVGGHFRVQLLNRVNTEFYADVLPTTIHNKATRMDYHIGWSVMYYLITAT